ncbi:MAG: hypothetical protein HGA56_03400 [Chlorobiaceae bacterium]|nr:hypothetical protein [Chlorobiaceae bacterium]
MMDRLPLVKSILTKTAVAGILTMPVISSLRDEYAFTERCPAEAVNGMLRILQHDVYFRKSTGASSMSVAGGPKDRGRSGVEPYG